MKKKIIINIKYAYKKLERIKVNERRIKIKHYTYIENKVNLEGKNVFLGKERKKIKKKLQKNE